MQTSKLGIEVSVPASIFEFLEEKSERKIEKNRTECLYCRKSAIVFHVSFLITYNLNKFFYSHLHVTSLNCTNLG